MNPALNAQFEIYKPWLIITGVIVLFLLLRLTRKALRRRVDEIGYRLFGEKGLLIWFWLNAPGVALHELSHALVVLLFYPFGFRITSITFFRIQPRPIPPPGRRAAKSANHTSLQLGEVQYIRPQNRIMSRVGDGCSAIAPLFGGIIMFFVLYWAATGYTIWDAWNRWNDPIHLLRPGWPWWTLLFAPYLILTVTSELWPSSQDWRGARWLVISLSIFLLFLLVLLWLIGSLVFNRALLLSVSSLSVSLNFTLAILLGLDLIFLFFAEGIVQLVRR